MPQTLRISSNIKVVCSFQYFSSRYSLNLSSASQRDRAFSFVQRLFYPRPSTFPLELATMKSRQHLERAILCFSSVSHSHALGNIQLRLIRHPPHTSLFSLPPFFFSNAWLEACRSRPACVPESWVLQSVQYILSCSVHLTHLRQATV